MATCLVDCELRVEHVLLLHIRLAAVVLGGKLAVDLHLAAKGKGRAARHLGV